LISNIESNILKNDNNLNKYKIDSIEVHLIDFNYWEILDPKNNKIFYVYKDTNKNLVCDCNKKDCIHIKSVLSYNKNKFISNFDFYDYI